MKFDLLRKQMVEQQLIPRGISDERVLEAFCKVPRHEFVPRPEINSAYGDFPLPIGSEQTISQPYMVALMTECLNLKGREKTLEIGTGSGYQAAILAEICGEVYTVERVPELAERAQRKIKGLGITNVFVKVDDGTIGWEEFAPYEGIIVTAGAPTIPEALVRQLKEGGRLVIPVGGSFNQTLTVVEKKKGNEVITQEICGCVFVPLIGKEGWKGD